VRYLLLAFGNAGELVPLFYLAILVHGICYDFFFMTGQLYTDQEAPAHLRNTAQGFIQFLTYGVGMFLGSLLSGVTVDAFSTGSGDTVVRNWQGFWITSAVGAFLIFLLVAAVFRSRGRIETAKSQAAA
jgi:MFS family permease